MIVVFDSGVWISAFHFGGTPLAALDAASGKYHLAIGEPVLAEIHRVRRLKFNRSEVAIKDALTAYPASLTGPRVGANLRGVCRDPKDDMVLECALLSGASVIVSGDKDLLSLGSFENIRILTPRDFLELQRLQSQ